MKKQAERLIEDNLIRYFVLGTRLRLDVRKCCGRIYPFLRVNSQQKTKFTNFSFQT